MSTMTDKQQRASIFLTAVLPALFFAIGVGGLYAMYSVTPISESAPPRQLAPLVESVAVESHQGGVDLAVDGVVTPFREIELSAEVAGRIVLKSPICRAGHFVSRGAVLLEIDPRDYELELQRLNDQLAQSEVNLAECDVELESIRKVIALAQEEHSLQKNELARVQRLTGAVSESDVDKAKRAEWNSRNNLLTLDNQIHLIETRRRGLENARGLVRTQIEKAQLDLERTKIRSPVDGILVKDVVEQDSFVQKGALVAVVEDTTKVEVRCSLKMDELVWIWQQAAGRVSPSAPTASRPAFAAAPLNAARQSQPADVVTNASVEGQHENELQPVAAHEVPSLGATGNSWRPHYELPQTPVTVSFRMQGSPTRYLWQGVLTRFDGSGIDERTRTVPCRVVVDDPRAMSIVGNPETTGPQALVRGMFVTVSIHARPQTTFLHLPESAVQPGKNVLRVRAGKLDIIGPLQLVQLAEQKGSHGGPDKYWVIHPLDTDLQPGDRVVTSPLPTAHPGMEVREQVAR